MNQLKINISCSDQYHLLAYSANLADWLIKSKALVQIRLYDFPTDSYMEIPVPHELEDKHDISLTGNILEPESLSMAEILLSLNDPKAVKERVILLKGNLIHSNTYSSAICGISDNQIPGLKTFSSEDFQGLIAFIKNRHAIILQKKQLRKEISNLKRQYTSEEISLKSEIIRKQIENNDVFKKAKTIFCYWSMPDEVDTQKLITDWFPAKKFILPVVAGNNLILREFSGREDMKPESQFGILEPIGKLFTDYQSIELSLIPGIAFDENFNRLGRGKGYYDRVVDSFTGNTRLFGLAFDFQKVDSVPTEEHDRKIDNVFYG